MELDGCHFTVYLTHLHLFVWNRNRWDLCTLVVTHIRRSLLQSIRSLCSHLMGEEKKRLELITNSNGPFDCNQHTHIRAHHEAKARFHCSIVKHAFAGNGFGINLHCTWTIDKFRQSDMVFSTDSIPLYRLRRWTS